MIERVPAGKRIDADLARWGEHAHAELKVAGYRSGGARSAVLGILSEQDCCLSAQQIHDELRAAGHGIGIASVYRALDVLARTDLVRRVELGAAAYYEPALPSGEHHHHAVCDSCGKVTAFEDAKLEAAIDRLTGRLDYTSSGHEIVIHGACPTCRRGALGASASASSRGRS